MTEAQPVGVDRFHHDGRGPELRRVCWGGRGTVLEAIEYFNPEVEYTDAKLLHVRFSKVQIVSITPEEVVHDETLGKLMALHRPAAAFDLGRDSWLSSFAQTHLVDCRHFQLMFYDELFDVICESLAFESGPFRPGRQ